MRTIFQLVLALLFVSCTLSCGQQFSPVSEKHKPTDYQNGSQPNTTENRDQNTPAAALTILPPQNVELRATGSLTQINLGNATVQNAVGIVSIVNDAPAAGFPVGLSQVTWVAQDEAGRTVTAIQSVFVDVSLACSTERLFFNQRIWPILNNACMECHTDKIVESSLNFVSEQTPDYLNTNYEKMRQSALLLDGASVPLFLSKIQNLNNSHVGGEIFNNASFEYSLLKSMVDRFGSCAEVASLPAEVITVTPLQQLRKITLSLSSRLPAPIELAQVTNAGTKEQVDLAMGNILDSILTEDMFYQRLKEIYNDVLLTDAYSQNAKALSLDLSNFNNSKYFGNLQLMQQGYNGTDSNAIREAANYGVSQAPLALIEFVVRNERPFTEILQADYVLVNPYSATLFNVSIPGNPSFNFVYGDNISQHDEKHFLPAQLIDSSSRKIPHAGLLTTNPFLGRYPSTNTNLNRKRARYIFEYFLGLDIEGISDRAGLNLDNVLGQTPTLEDPQCKVCHDILDPVAGLFKNWGNKGAFLGDNQNWRDKRQPPEMLSPGFNGAQLPADQSASSLKWLASKIAQDDRFAVTTVKTVYRGITGINSEIEPVFMQTMKQGFIASGYNLKSLIKIIVQDDSFLALNATQFLTFSEDDVHGTAHLLTPEQLYRKINSLFNGMQWQSPGKRNLLSTDSYRLLYGGIDSREVTERTTEATSLIAGVQMRVANQLSCQLVPQDFNLPKSQRNLFPFVEINSLPEAAGDAVFIRQNIQFLYEKILGQQYDVTHPEITRVFNLFSSAHNLLGVEGVVRECQGDLSDTNAIVIDSNKTVRSWMAVVNFMLRDYGFLYE